MSAVFPRLSRETFVRVRSNRRNCAAFSLVEILVSIGVIAVLAALLVPAVSRQAEAGRSASCMGNLRGLATAVAQFRVERDQVMWNRSAVADGGEGDIAPARVLYRYGVIESAREMRCPSATTAARGAWKTGGTGDAEYTKRIADQFVSYAVNDIAFYQTTPYMMSASPISRFVHFAGHEAKTPLFMDGTFFQLNQTTWRGEARFDRLALRHNERCNILFLDGHVEAMDREAASRIDPYGGTNPRWWQDFGKN